MTPDILPISELERLANEARAEAVQAATLPAWLKLGFAGLVTFELIVLVAMTLKGGL